MLTRMYDLFALSAALLIVTAIAGCDAAPSLKERQEKARAAVGIDASVTATMLVSAARSCQVVGVSDIDTCTQLKGTLIADRSAQMLAGVAVDRRKDFWKKCQADFDQEYCSQLIQRAVAIELRKPIASE